MTGTLERCGAVRLDLPRRYPVFPALGLVFVLGAMIISGRSSLKWDSDYKNVCDVDAAKFGRHGALSDGIGK